MTVLAAPRISANPLVLETKGWDDYALLDSGDGRKLERFGPYHLIRPEAQCLWRPGLGPDTWAAADAVFEGQGDDEQGRWKFRRAAIAPWPLGFGAVAFEARLTAFRHVGVFPEQAVNWSWIESQIADRPPPRLLNLFGYTGIASLVAAAAGAQVTHVDASRKAVDWGKENAAIAGLSERPIRWICEDARKWVSREQRRGARYDAILLDPPKFGRGPTGETWRLYEDLRELLEGCFALLSDQAQFLLLNTYSERLSSVALASLVAECANGKGGAVDWGELALAEASRPRTVGLSFFARWTAR